MSENVSNTVEDLGDYHRPKSDNKRSAFFVTINPNISADTEGEFRDLVQTMKDLGKYLFSNEALSQIIKFIDEYSDDEFNTYSIKSISTKFHVEIGDQMHRVHLHAFCKIEHQSKIRLDQAMIRALAIDWLNENGFPEIQNVHVDIKAANTEQTILDYLNK